MGRIALLLLAFFSMADGENLANWKADHPPCNRHSELLNKGHMILGVRLATANPVLAQQFRRAMDSWANVLDLDWHEVDNQECSIQLLDGEKELFQPSAIVARSQLPDRPDFQGWIAFNPGQKLEAMEFYRIALHEIGHILGLKHSSNVLSVMYSLDLDGHKWLDPVDLADLASRHKLRIETIQKSVKLTEPEILAGTRD